MVVRTNNGTLCKAWGGLLGPNDPEMVNATSSPIYVVTAKKASEIE